ncbi:ABC transporter ATP-binding protein [Marinitenerispora sediminis]|uniref:ABC-type quaternary amine transporter n=1 Tax=Marinitenerispora sediminis TaxID=1931232 RepID=A0A368T049_9ACTN|nr:ATP-binding cassette domain-containing protein [Marinitenerispora sediminis]RCV48532.1 proline/glycine betaine ABC transporter ATP-binding protein [Marinitenerispora sediminis]RCV51785.1 proline/glycine betaine ABC transporter ATP-binding protein [Marinitenerispora sediminis]RCV57142.1 proline/glycine betaine ABC transporter ATP-binding protein [Marinitenerispora sediminis]
MITFDGVTKRYPDGNVAVDHLDLEIPAGQTTVLVGPSGCGKTTSLRMINRMVEPSTGRIRVDGRDVRDQDPAELRRSIGYVIQQAGLFPHRTVADNIATVPYLLGWDRRRARTRAHELMELVGLDADLARRYPHQLSGGQQQRVGVARALAADPPVLLMDEPFSAVDPVVRTSLQDELLRLQQELHKTIVFVTHDIDEAVRLGDTIAVFRPGGRLAQAAAPERLLAEPADDFVEGFIGYDRGVRRLSFFPARELRLRGDAVLAADTPVATARAVAAGGGEPWLLVVDDARRPRGWVSADLLTTADAQTPLGDLPLVGFGHVFTVEDDSLRAALDAAVLSPAGRAVGVTQDGTVVGVVAQSELGEAIWSVGNDDARDAEPVGQDG